MMEKVMKFCGGEFGDDVTLIAAAVHWWNESAIVLAPGLSVIRK